MQKSTLTHFLPLPYRLLFLALSFLILSLIPLAGWAQAFTATYSFDDVTSSSGRTDSTVVPEATGVIFGPFTASDSVSGNSSAAGRFSFTGWEVGATDNNNDYAALTGSLNPEEYYEVTITPRLGFTFNVTDITFTVERSATGIRTYAVRSSLDGFTSNLAATVAPANDALSVQPDSIFFWNNDTTTSDQEGSTIHLNAAHTDLERSITFRFYGWNAEGSSGTFSIDNVAFTGTAIASEYKYYTWVGEGSAPLGWQDPANWDPPREAPDPSDIVVFAGGTTDTVSNVPTQTLAGMMIQGQSKVTLVPAGPEVGPDTSSNILTLEAINTTALDVASGAELILDSYLSNTSLAISLPSGAQALIQGTVTFTSTTGTSGIYHRLLATDEDAVRFQSGATFNAIKFNGHPFGDSEPAHTTRFDTGSFYVSRGGAHPFGFDANENISKVRFDSGSLFRQQQTGSVALVGRTYGDFELSLPDPSQVYNVPFGGNGALQVDNLDIVSGTLNFPLNANNRPLNINLKGNLIVAEGAAFNYSPNDSTATSTLSFIGETAQSISGPGFINFGPYSVFHVNTPASVTLVTPLALAGELRLTKGLVHTSITNLLTVAPAGTITGGSNASYISGPIQRGVSSAGPTSLLFPVGGNGAYRPITLHVTLGADPPSLNLITVRQIEGAPTSREIPFSLTGVSDLRYYNIISSNNAQITSVGVTIHYNEDDRVSDPGNLRIARSELNTWVNLGGEGIPSGENSQSGIITGSVPDDGSLGDFVLANAEGGDNVLPVELISFTGTREQVGIVLRWSTASETNNQGFEIHRSPNGTDWEKIGFVAGHGTSQTTHAYQFVDQAYAEATTYYYRLKQLDQDGTYAFSHVVAVQTDGLALAVVLYPNPVADVLHLNLDQQHQEVRIRIVNLLGQVVFEKEYPDRPHQLSENLSSLPAGAYLLEIHSSQGRTSHRLVKTSR